MLSKRGIIAALVGLNLVLLAAILLSVWSPPAAYAQRMGGSGQFIAVTCEADEAHDVLYLVDLPNRTLHAFMPTRQQDGKVQYIGSRDLERDFEGGQ